MTRRNPQSSTARLTAAFIAIIAGLATFLQPSLGEESYLQNFANLLRFFTIWSNVGAIAVMALVALGRPQGQRIMAALATALTVVGLVYWLLLASIHHPEGFDRVTNQVHHTFVPIAVVLWWLAFTPPADRIAPLVPAIMVPPLAYGAFAFVLGQLTGFYAYFFLDLPQLGWTAFLLNNLGLSVFFAGLGAALLAIQRMVARRF